MTISLYSTSSLDESRSVTESSGLGTDPSPSMMLRTHCNPVSLWYLEAVSWANHATVLFKSLHKTEMIENNAATFKILIHSLYSYMFGNTVLVTWISILFISLHKIGVFRNNSDTFLKNFLYNIENLWGNSNIIHL